MTKDGFNYSIYHFIGMLTVKRNEVFSRSCVYFLAVCQQRYLEIRL